MRALRSILLATATLVCAPVMALTFSASPAGTGPYKAWNKYTTPDPATAFVATGNVPGAALPINTVSYLAVLSGGEATVSTGGANAFGFLWGSPDAENLVTFATSSGIETFSGLDLGHLVHFPATSNRDYAYVLWAYGTAGQTIESVTFTSPVNASLHAFEVAAVPEPTTTVLMLGALGWMAGTARRRTRC